MARAKIKKPKEEQNLDPRFHSLYYTLNDLYVGGIVNFNSHHFLITAADEYVFSYMERESEKEKVHIFSVPGEGLHILFYYQYISKMIRNFLEEYFKQMMPLFSFHNLMLERFLKKLQNMSKKLVVLSN